MAKALASKKKKEAVVEPEVVENAEVVEEFEPKNAVAPVGTNPHDARFTVKLDTRKFDNRTFYQVQTLLEGALGTFKKVTIEQE